LLLSDNEYHKLNQNIGECLAWASQVSFAKVEIEDSSGIWRHVTG
jgi:hypothetical protein